MCKRCTKIVEHREFCPVCSRAWRLQNGRDMANANGVRMLQCDDCNAWVHFACEKLDAKVSKQTEDWASTAYKCPTCRRCKPGEGLVLPARQSCGKCFSCDDAYLSLIHI